MPGREARSGRPSEMKKGILFGVILAAAMAGSYFLKPPAGPVDRGTTSGTAQADLDLVGAGQKIFFGKGQCALCHTLEGEGRGKCPDLQNAGARLTREFIYEAMTKPEAYIRLDFDPAEPKRFPSRMPAIDKPPIGLTEDEILTVLAFVQSQGEKVTVDRPGPE